MKKYLEAGKITGTHGIRGEVRVQPWCDNAGVLADLDTLYINGDMSARRTLSVSSRVHKNMVIMKIEGVDTIDQAAALRDTLLWLDRDDIPLSPGQYFIQDIIGLDIVDTDSGCKYGTLSDVSNNGANNIYHIDTSAGIVLMPAVEEFVKHIDLETRIIKIKALKGLFDHED